MGHEVTDRGWIVGAMDGVVTPIQAEHRFAHRVARRPAGNRAGQIRIGPPYVCRWCPGRADEFSLHISLAMPCHAGLADADRIADRAAVALHVVEAALAGAHNDRARRIAAESDDFARGCKLWISGAKENRRDERAENRPSPQNGASHHCSTITGVPTD